MCGRRRRRHGDVAGTAANVGGRCCSRVPPTCGIALQMFTDGMVELETTVNFNLMNSTASVD